MLNINIKKDFPIFNNSYDKNKKPLIYLDSASTAQKPISVLNAVSDYLSFSNANIHRGAYKLSISSTKLYDVARESVRKFIGAKYFEEIIFTKGVTEAINMIAYTYGESNINSGDEIVISILEHHSNLIPWQRLVKRKNAKLIFMYCDETGDIPESELEKISSRAKIVSITGMSNALGNIPPVKKIIDKAHSVGAITIVDAAQSIAHCSTNVAELDADFLAFSGHKIMSPLGVGVLYGKKHLLENMPPFLYGGDMVEYVTEQKTTFAPLPQKFEAGTQNMAGVVGLKAAIDYINSIGMENIATHEKMLTEYALTAMQEDENIILYGKKNMENRGGVISFGIKDVHPHDIASIVDAEDNVAVRSGHHCAQPLMKYLGIPSTCRASLYIYNTTEDIDVFVNSLKKVRKWLGYGS